MTFDDAQRDMNAAYVRGAPGVAVSGLAWVVAGLVWAFHDVRTGFAALFVGGILIMPLSLVIASSLFHAPKVDRANPLNRLAIEGTFFLFAGLLIAYILSARLSELIFPVMAVTIGTRYFTFRTLYGEVLYWVLGGAIATVGLLASLHLWPVNVNLAVVVGLIELAFSALLIRRFSAA